jgi:hypothetical protein
MVVFVSRRQIVAIRDKKVVIPGCEVVVSGMNENGEPMRSPCNVRAGYRLAISSAMTALTASRRVDPAGASLVGVALSEWTNHKKPAKGSGYCKFRFHRPVPRVNSPWCVSPSTQLPRSCDTPQMGASLDRIGRYNDVHSAAAIEKHVKSARDANKSDKEQETAGVIADAL